VKWAVAVAVVILLGIGAFLLNPNFYPWNDGVSQLSLSERHGQNATAITSGSKSQESTGQLGEQTMPMPTSASQTKGAISDTGRVETGSGLTQKPVEKIIANPTSDGTMGVSRVEFVKNHTEVASKPSQVSPVTRAVKEGDNLSQIANEVYGSSSRQYVEWVRRHNPQISDPNIILPGQKIVLPEYIKE